MHQKPDIYILRKHMVTVCFVFFVSRSAVQSGTKPFISQTGFGKCRNGFHAAISASLFGLEDDGVFV